MTFLEQANELIDGPRAKDYGSASENHQRIATIWSVILGIDVSPEKVAMCMVGVKLARLCNTPGHKDSWIDIAGYVGVADKIQRGE